jgi:hypothetical protein
MIFLFFKDRIKQNMTRTTALIDVDLDIYTVDYIMDFVVRNEQKEKYKKVLFEFKSRIIYLFHCHPSYSEIIFKDESIFVGKNTPDHEFVDKSINKLYNNSKIKNFDIFLNDYFDESLEQIDDYFEEYNLYITYQEGWIYQNKVFFNSISFVSWLLQPVRIFDNTFQVYIDINMSYNYLGTVYYNINDQIEKQGFYKFDLTFDWISYYQDIERYFDSIVMDKDKYD